MSGLVTGVAPERLVFVGGLHRSGTTMLGHLLSAHPECSGIEGSGVPEDEGQHLQDIYRPAVAHGGPGRFARAAAAHLGEVPPEHRLGVRESLLRAWMPYWDLGSDFLVEKSPPNLIMGRYLQSVFPGSTLIVILRHPVVVALSTKKWRPRTSLFQLVEHWEIAHQILREDAASVDRLVVVRYEDLVADPGREAARLGARVGLRAPTDPGRLVQASHTERYVQTWEAMATGSPLSRASRRRIERRFSATAATYGYDVSDFTVRRPWTF